MQQKLCRTGGGEEPPFQPPEERSNQMRQMSKVLPFTLGVLVGTVVATAWAHFPHHSTVTASAPETVSAPRPAAASMNPLDMMLNLRPLPLQQFDPF